MAREERHIKRLTTALVIAIIGIVVCNMAWLYAWTQYDYSDVDSGYEVSLDSNGGNANYIGNRGLILNGEDQSTELDTDTHKD